MESIMAFFITSDIRRHRRLGKSNKTEVLFTVIKDHFKILFQVSALTIPQTSRPRAS